MENRHYLTADATVDLVKSFLPSKLSKTASKSNFINDNNLETETKDSSLFEQLNHMITNNLEDVKKTITDKFDVVKQFTDFSKLNSNNSNNSNDDSIKKTITDKFDVVKQYADFSSKNINNVSEQLNHMITNNSSDDSIKKTITDKFDIVKQFTKLSNNNMEINRENYPLIKQVANQNSMNTSDVIKLIKNNRENNI